MWPNKQIGYKLENENVGSQKWAESFHLEIERIETISTKEHGTERRLNQKRKKANDIMASHKCHKWKTKYIILVAIIQCACSNVSEH